MTDGVPLALSGLKTARLFLVLVFLLTGATVWSLGSLPARAQSCAGDCDENGEVLVNELVTCVNIALGLSSMDDCPAADADNNEEVRVDDLIKAVNAALSDCLAPGTGSIRAELTGNLPPSEWVTLALDEGTERSLSPGGSLVFPELDPGRHEVRVGQLPENCQIVGGNVWAVDVTTAQTSQLLLEASCAAEPAVDPDVLVLLESAGRYQKGDSEYREQPGPAREEKDDEGNTWGCTTRKVTAEQFPLDYPTFNPNAEVIYPGAMLQGGTLVDATPELIRVARGAGTVDINLLNGTTEPVHQHVATADRASVLQAINKIISDNAGIIPAYFTFQSSEVQSTEQLALSLGVNVSTLSTDVQSKLSFSQDKRYNRFLVQMIQQFYTITFSPENLFAPGVTEDDLNTQVGEGNPATWISSVTYGRRFYLLIESTSTTRDMRASINATYNAALADVNMSFDSTYVRDLRDVQIKVFALGGDASLAAATFNGNFEQVRDFLTEGASIETGVPLSYVVRHVVDNTVAYVKVATDYDIKTCAPAVVVPDGRATLYGWVDWTAENVWETQGLDVDTSDTNGNVSVILRCHPDQCIAKPPFDLTNQTGANSRYDYFIIDDGVQWALAEPDKSFEEISLKDHILPWLATNGRYGGSAARGEGSMFVLKTGQGNFAKLKVIRITGDDSTSQQWRYQNVDVRFTTYTRAYADLFTRFVDNGDGTVSDKQTGLMWEKKTNDHSVHGVGKRFQWSTGEPWGFDGTAKTQFLDKLNDAAGGGAQCFAGHCDWRLPEVDRDDGREELETILLNPYPCPASPCIDPIFGPTAADVYWSRTTDARSTGYAWRVSFLTGEVLTTPKSNEYYVRAVRDAQ